MEDLIVILPDVKNFEGAVIHTKSKESRRIYNPQDSATGPARFFGLNFKTLLGVGVSQRDFPGMKTHWRVVDTESLLLD